MTTEAQWLATGTVLDRILERTAADLTDRRAAVPVTELERRAADRPAARPLRDAIGGPGVSVIAEIKRGSPSRGMFPATIDVAKVAGAYVAGGAAALSVLTDGPFFHGSLDDLAVAVDTVADAAPPRPVLRKDFMLDEYQLVEARAYGADVILLIVAALDDATLARLMSTATGLGLSVLTEVHDEEEMRRAIAAGADNIGINNRDLRDFRVDLATTERLAPMVPAGTLLVGESGIFTAADLGRMADCGVSAVLVGESLIVQPDRTAAVRTLREGQPGVI
ncbi:MAG TPA: indole-3-glycerol phosphate synthase TrpC [Thermomicrobiales bacterium]|jgi:indole-3-glycerol phosphate synthase|nr:indole-3-glycerol phosphate synthase TrpC [Thermomicrobiales bacterium]